MSYYTILHHLCAKHHILIRIIYKTYPIRLKKNVYFESFFFWRMDMFACSSQNLSMQPVTALIHNYSRIADYIHWICNEYQRTKRFNARTMNREECINWNTIAVVYVYIYTFELLHDKPVAACLWIYFFYAYVYCVRFAYTFPNEMALLLLFDVCYFDSIHISTYSCLNWFRRF